MTDSDCRGVWREGSYLIAQNRVAQLPPICAICGEEIGCRPLSCRVRRRPGIIGFFLWWLPIFSPAVVIKASLCRDHRFQERMSRLIGHCILMAAIAFFIGAFYMAANPESPKDTAVVLGCFAVMTTWGWVYYRIFRRRAFWANDIRKPFAQIPGISDAVLDRVPELPTTADA